MYYHLFFYLIWKVVKKHKTFFWESGVRYNLSGSVIFRKAPTFPNVQYIHNNTKVFNLRLHSMRGNEIILKFSDMSMRQLRFLVLVFIDFFTFFAEIHSLIF